MGKLNEYLEPTPDGKGGILRPDGTGDAITITWGEVNNKERFEELLNWRGDFAKFAYYHNIGCYFTNKKSRAYWLGEESHYDEDDFFFMTDVPGYEDKKIAFQLRVSNHAAQGKAWETTHSNGSIPSLDGGGRISRPEIKADFCLNLIFNEDPRDARLGKSSNEAVKIRVVIVDCVCNYYKMNGEERARIDDFVNAITSGQRPTISYNDLYGLFVGGYETKRKSGKPTLDIRHSGPENVEIRPHNFSDRKNLPRERVVFGWNGERGTEEIKKIPFSFLIDNDVEDRGEFVYKGKKFVYDYDNSVAYPIKLKRRTHEEYVDYDSPIEVIDESVIHIGRNELVEMVKQCLKRILF